MSTHILTDEERERFGWQIMMTGFGEDSQVKLKQSSALVSRVGGLGSPVALYLAMAGIGKLVIAHGGVPEMGHMNRWIMSPYEGVGKVSPVDSVIDHIRKLNPTIELVGVKESVTEENVQELVSQADIIMDCPPYFEERHLLNREAIRQQKPMVEAAVCGAEGYVTVIVPGETPCMSCLGFHSKDWELPFPVIGAVPGVIGSMAAMEAVKMLTGYGEPLKNRLVMYNGETASYQTIKLKRRANCPVCDQALVFQ
ncbi:adenylyltransferase [Xylanibacillus composti]|uniref:Adenylyltransferase n=1 Tax=Xylanibacillus composti TaxID=1572762 RepID=A0A8J4M3M2_9BACL|nr:HesA/MoeB/ThiF family protein [Xylanibacillus composti]GIQ69651.1 adenylyltransferase [Xylanibacillus composti]